jgi:tetratricopeptide (TPR) repeat protein
MIQPASGFSRAIRAAAALLPMVMATPWLMPIFTAARQNSSQQSSAQALSPGIPIERELSGGQAHEYKIALLAGQGIKIKAEQRGIDLVLLLNGPDGKELFEENGWDENYGTELIVWAAQTSGVYQLRVQAAGKDAALGRYEIRIETPQADERFATAIQKFNEGMQLATQKDKKLDQSLSRFEESLKLWQALGDRDMEGRALFFAASNAFDLNEYPKTVDYSLRALEIFRAFGMKKEEYVTLSVVSSGYSGTGDYLKGLFYDRQRIPLLSVASPVAAVNLHTNLGILSRQIGDYQKAQEYLGEALAKARGLGAKREELLALSALATLSFVSNEPLKSVEYINAALPLSRELKQPLREGRLLLQLGQIYARVSEPQQAISLFKQALQLLDRPEGRADRAQTLMIMSDTLKDVGETAAALEALNQALALTREISTKALEMRTLTRIGGILSERGEFQKAIEYQQQARDFLHANAIRGEEVTGLMDLARTYERMGQRQKARELLDQALTLTRTLKGGGSEAAILRRQALFSRDDGDLKQARELMEAALRNREELRNKFAGQSLKASYGASSQDFYEAYLDILKRMHEQSPPEG